MQNWEGKNVGKILIVDVVGRVQVVKRSSLEEVRCLVITGVEAFYNITARILMDVIERILSV